MTSPHPSPSRFKGNFFKNPFVLLPAPTPLTFPKGRVTPELLLHYGALARSEVALVIVGPATVVPPASRKYSLLRVDQPKYLDGLHALCKVIRANGAIPGIQIAHPDGYHADEILRGISRFKAMMAAPQSEKIQVAYRNAVTRSREVGFSYVELNGCDRLFLHRLMAEDHRDEVAALFVAALAGSDERTIVALRVHAMASNAATYGQMFLAAGGNMIGAQVNQAGVDHGQFEPRRLMTNLSGFTPPGKIRALLRDCRLIGLSGAFDQKQRQILDYVAEQRSRKHGLMGSGEE